MPNGLDERTEGWLGLLINPDAVGPDFSDAIDTLGLGDTSGDQRLSALAALVLLGWAISGDGEENSSGVGNVGPDWGRERLKWVSELISDTDPQDRFAAFSSMSNDQIGNAVSEVKSYLETGLGLSKESMDDMEYELSQGVPVSQLVSRVVGGISQLRAQRPETWDVQDGHLRVAARNNLQLAPFLATEKPDLDFVGEVAAEQRIEGPVTPEHRLPTGPSRTVTRREETDWLSAQDAESQRDVIGNIMMRLDDRFRSRMRDGPLRKAMLGDLGNTENLALFVTLRDEVMGAWGQVAASAQGAGIAGEEFLFSRWDDRTQPGWEQGYLDKLAAERANEVSPLQLYSPTALEDLVEREFLSRLGRAARPAEIATFREGAHAAQRAAQQARAEGTEHEGYDPGAEAGAFAEESDPERADFVKYHDAARGLMEGMAARQAGR